MQLPTTSNWIKLFPPLYFLCEYLQKPKNYNFLTKKNELPKRLTGRQLQIIYVAFVKTFLQNKKLKKTKLQFQMSNKQQQSNVNNIQNQTKRNVMLYVALTLET